MNNTLKSICDLLKSDSPEIQHAAAVVMQNMSLREAGAYKIVGEALSVCENAETIPILINILKRSPQEQNIRYLLSVVDNPAVPQEEIIDAISSVGSKAVNHLQRAYSKCSEPIKFAIIHAMSVIRSDPALAFLVSCFFDKDATIVREAIRSVRQSFPEFNKKERLTLHTQLKKALSDKRTKSNDLPLSAILITFGIMGEAKNKKLILPYIDQSKDRKIRRYALSSLAQIDYKGDSNGDAIKALFAIINEEDDEELIRLTVDALMKIPPRKSDADKLVKMLDGQHPSCVHSFALRTLGKIDLMKNAEILISFLKHKDQNLRAAAEEVLPNMNSALNLLLKSLDASPTLADAEYYIPALGSFRDRIKPDAINTLVKKMFQNFDEEDERYLVYLQGLIAVDGNELKKGVVLRAGKAKKSKNFTGVKEYLKLLEGTEFLTYDLKLDLVIAKLKSGGKPVKRGLRTTDYGLRQISELLQENGKDFVSDFLKNKQLSADDYFFVGQHFLDRLNEERRFGADCLQHITKKFRNTKAAKKARAKLKEELNL